MKCVLKFIIWILIASLIIPITGCGNTDSGQTVKISISGQSAEPIKESVAFIVNTNDENETFIYKDQDGAIFNDDKLVEIAHDSAKNFTPITFFINNSVKSNQPINLHPWIGNYQVRITLEQGHNIGDCINGNPWHLNFEIKDRSEKILVGMHFCAWWENGPQFGIYNKTDDSSFCATTRGKFTEIKEAIKNTILKMSPSMPNSVVSAIAYTSAIIVMSILIVPLVAQEPSNPTPTPNISSGNQFGNGQSNNSSPTPEPTPIVDNSIFLEWPGNPDSSTAPEYNDFHKNPNDEFWIDIWAKNEGNTTWEGDKYYLQNNFAEKGFGNLPDHINLDYTIKPGEVWHKRFVFITPNESGRYRLTCRIGKDAYTEFGNYINWDIVVTANNNAGFLEWPYTPESSEAPEFNNRAKLPGEDFWIDYGVKNSGNTTWKSGSYYFWNNFKTRGFGNFSDHIYLDHDVKPGEVWSKRFNFCAPINLGTYRLTCRMGKDSNTEFGNYTNWDIIVNNPSPTPTPSPSPSPIIAFFAFNLTVINYFGREPMPNVTVLFDNKEYLTNAQGKFQLDVLKGQYSLEVKKDGFIAQTATVDITGPLTQTIVLRPTTLPSPYFFTSAKTGENYYLYFDEVTLSDGTTKKIYYFSREVGGENACDLPEGYTVEENPRTGLPMLRRI